MPDPGLWPLWLGLVLVPLVGIAAWWFAPDTSDPGRYVGICLGLAVWLWLTLFALGLKARAPLLQAVLFGGFWLALILGGLLGGHQRREQQRQAATALLADLDRIGEAVLSDAPKVIDNPFDDPAPGAGATDEIQRFTREFLRDIVAIRNAQIADLERIGWTRVFAGERLLADRQQDFRESRAMLQQALRSIDQHEQQAVALYEGVEQRLQQYTLSPAERASVLRGAAQGKAAQLQRMQAIVDLDRQAMRLMGEQLELLRGSPDWQIEGEQILFTEDAPLAKFNALGMRIDALTAHQEQLQREALQQGRSRIEPLTR